MEVTTRAKKGEVRSEKTTFYFEHDPFDSEGHWNQCCGHASHAKFDLFDVGEGQCCPLRYAGDRPA